MEYLQPLQVIWDYLGMHHEPVKADVIVGFGNFNTDIARRAAELYHQGSKGSVNSGRTATLARRFSHTVTEQSHTRSGREPQWTEGLLHPSVR